MCISHCQFGKDSHQIVKFLIFVILNTNTYGILVTLIKPNFPPLTGRMSLLTEKILERISPLSCPKKENSWIELDI